MIDLKVSEKHILVEYVEDEHEDDKDYTPSFWYCNSRYYLSDFVKPVTPWHRYDVPDYIVGVLESYFHMLFIGITEENGDLYVDVYEPA